VESSTHRARRIEELESTDGVATEGDCNGSMPNAWCMIQSCAVLDETLPNFL